MGLLSWLFPSVDDKVARARDMIARGQHADARLELLDLDHPASAELIEQCERELAEKNLLSAVSWANARDYERVQVHLELADTFRKPGMDDLFREQHAEVRRIRDEQASKQRADHAEREARLLAVDPLGIAGSTSLFDPAEQPDLAEEDAIERQARVALLVENYPSALRETVRDLGLPFADAVLQLDDGAADLALQTLLALPDDAPLVCWERGRAAYRLGDVRAAARSVRRFADLAGGHHAMGRQHSGVFLAQLTAESGDTAEALRILRDVRSQNPDLGLGLFAQLLTAEGSLEDAETVLRAGVKKHPKALSLYALLAQVRLLGGHRVSAMTALERAMDQCACGTGKCGAVPPDLEIVRSLATLYLEDGLEQERALDLAQQAAGLVQQPRFEDAYLAALAGRARGDARAEDLVQQLHTALPEGDPRRGVLQEYLPLAS